MEKLARDAQLLFGVSLAPKQIAQFAVYERELLEWNEKFNLTSIRDVEGIRAKHFLDAISCILAWKDQAPRRLVDVGTGAGFPGIALKILYPSLKLTLVESIGKKATFCKHVIQTLEMENVEVSTGRAEDIGQDPAHRGKYDWAVARAVAALPILVEYLLPLVKVHGNILAQKGQGALAEINASENALKLLGGRMQQLIKVELPGVADERYLVVIDKNAETPTRYPRKAGLPAKKPL